MEKMITPKLFNFIALFDLAKTHCTFYTSSAILRSLFPFVSAALYAHFFTTGRMTTAAAAAAVVVVVLLLSDEEIS